MRFRCASARGAHTHALLGGRSTGTLGRIDPVAYLRFVVSKIDPDSGVEGGLFAAAYALRDSAVLPAAHRSTLENHLNWFRANLEIPSRFNRSRSKGYYRRATKGISWFRDTAKEHIARMHELKLIAEANGYVVSLVKEDRIGYVIYEDANQVIAEPFADTHTG